MDRIRANRPRRDAMPIPANTRVAGTMIVLLCRALVALFAPSRPAEAASYGGFENGDLRIVEVRDESGLFGAPAPPLNSGTFLAFPETSLRAACSNCPTGLVVTDRLTLVAEAIGTFRIRQLEFSAGFDYALHSFDAQGFASMTLTSSLAIEILELDHQPVSGLVLRQSILYSPTNEQRIPGIAIQSGVLLSQGSWIDLRSPVVEAGLQGFPTRISVQLEHILTVAHDGAGGQALIRHIPSANLNRIRIGDTYHPLTPIPPVDPPPYPPEPAPALLIFVGLAALASSGRGERRRRA